MRQTAIVVAVLYCCTWALGNVSTSVDDGTAPPASQCTIDEECSYDKGCVAETCVDVCVGKPCGSNSYCKVHHHHATCVCDEGYFGDPVEGCEKLARECEETDQCGGGRVCANGSCVAKECVSKVCGKNAVCVLEEGVAKCMCQLGLEGDGETECAEPPKLMSSTAPKVQNANKKREDTLCRGNRFPKPVGKKVYLPITHTKANWYNAYMYCVSHGHRFATVESEEENDMMLEVIKDSGVHNGNFYISGNDHSLETFWFWMTTGLPVKFTYWHVARPTCNTYLNCLAYMENDYPSGRVGYRWFDRLCTELNHFVCEDYVK